MALGLANRQNSRVTLQWVEKCTTSDIWECAAWTPTAWTRDGEPDAEASGEAEAIERCSREIKRAIHQEQGGDEANSVALCSRYWAQRANVGRKELILADSHIAGDRTLKRHPAGLNWAHKLRGRNNHNRIVTAALRFDSVLGGRPRGLWDEKHGAWYVPHDLCYAPQEQPNFQECDRLAIRDLKRLVWADRDDEVSVRTV